MTKPKAPRKVMVAVACFQNFACGGLIFGWAAISSSLLVASVQNGGAELPRGRYHMLMMDEWKSVIIMIRSLTTFSYLRFVLPSTLHTALVHQLFVIATSINFTAPLLLGALLDAYGPRVCSVLSLLLVTAGFILFSFSSPTFHTALPSIVLIAFGGPGVQSSIIHLSNLYPTAKATVTSIITGYVPSYTWMIVPAA